jgi:hypothetical protein
MSLPLKDFRTALPEATDMWLDIEAAATGRDKAAIARDVLGEWARLKAHAHKVASKRLAANGLQPELFGLDAEEAGAGPVRVRR